MNTGSTLNIRDASLLVGPAWSGSPAVINRALFAVDGWLSIGRVKGGAVEVFAREPVEFRGRVLFPVFLKHPQFSWHQPFYRSTGQSMPTASPAGTIWPVSGVYTEKYCQKRGFEATEVGYIGKYFCNPRRHHWVAHCNDRTRVWPFLSEVVSLLTADASPESAAGERVLVGALSC